MAGEVLAEVESVLLEARSPLHYREITRLVLERGKWSTRSSSPEGVINAYLSQDIQQHEAQSRFRRAGRGMIALGVWPATATGRAGTDTHSSPHSVSAYATTETLQAHSFADAAERVLESVAGKQPMHYRDITKKALELGLVQTRGRTPEANLYTQIWTEIDRMTRRGETPRFVKVGPGMFALSRWQQQGLAHDIEQHNAAVRRMLHEQLKTMPPVEFEALIHRLLGKIGFEEVTVTDYSGDGGIDVRGILVVGDVIRTRMAVQVKRWNSNVQAQIVQQVRGSLGTHDQGLIITTSGFSKGAKDEAQRTNAVPVALMDGEQLVALLFQHNLLVRRKSHDLFELGEVEDE